MEDRVTARMRKYGESKTTRIMMATVPHVISVLGLRKFQANGFLLTRVYIYITVGDYLISEPQIRVIVGSSLGTVLQIHQKSLLPAAAGLCHMRALGLSCS